MDTPAYGRMKECEAHGFRHRMSMLSTARLETSVTYGDQMPAQQRNIQVIVTFDCLQLDAAAAQIEHILKHASRGPMRCLDHKVRACN
jgi:hypothetical protein